ncbi:MAG: hypothetical protein ABSD77_09680, partial [Verrucomicrobiota bacterium]
PGSFCFHNSIFLSFVSRREPRSRRVIYDFSPVHLLPAATAPLKGSNPNARKQKQALASFFELLSAILRLFSRIYRQWQPVCPAST